MQMFSMTRKYFCLHPRASLMTKIVASLFLNDEVYHIVKASSARCRPFVTKRTIIKEFNYSSAGSTSILRLQPYIALAIGKVQTCSIFFCYGRLLSFLDEGFHLQMHPVKVLCLFWSICCKIKSLFKT